MKITGVYQIQSKIKPERIYIGSAIRISERWQHHKSDLKSGRHTNTKLQNHCNKYGYDDLVFSVITQCDKDELVSNEQFFIDAYKPYFNISPSAYSCRGMKLSDETRLRISKAIKGRILSEEHKKRIGLANKGKGVGRKLSEETKLKKSLSMMGKNVGRKYSEEYKKEMSVKRRGRKLSEQHKQNISNGNKGRIFTDDTKKKISERLKGKKKKYSPWNKGKTNVYSEETLYKMGSGNRGKFKKVA